VHTAVSINGHRFCRHQKQVLISSTEKEDAAFTDILGELPWDKGIEIVNGEIGQWLEAQQPDPVPLEGISSPITINRKIGWSHRCRAGAFFTPDFARSPKSGWCWKDKIVRFSCSDIEREESRRAT
jgi:hypothetical protein